MKRPLWGRFLDRVHPGFPGKLELACHARIAVPLLSFFFFCRHSTERCFGMGLMAQDRSMRNQHAPIRRPSAASSTQLCNLTWKLPSAKPNPQPLLKSSPSPQPTHVLELAFTHVRGVHRASMHDTCHCWHHFRWQTWIPQSCGRWQL